MWRCDVRNKYVNEAASAFGVISDWRIFCFLSIRNFLSFVLGTISENIFKSLNMPERHENTQLNIKKWRNSSPLEAETL